MDSIQSVEPGVIKDFPMQSLERIHKPNRPAVRKLMETIPSLQHHGIVQATENYCEIEVRTKYRAMFLRAGPPNHF